MKMKAFVWSPNSDLFSPVFFPFNALSMGRSVYSSKAAHEPIIMVNSSNDVSWEWLYVQSCKML